MSVTSSNLQKPVQYLQLIPLLVVASVQLRILQSPSTESKASTRNSVVMCKQSIQHLPFAYVQVSQMTILPLYLTWNE